MPDSNDFGEPVSVSSMSSDIAPGTLPHPQDPWGTASAMDAPLASPAPAAPVAAPQAPAPAEPAAAPIQGGVRPLPPQPKATRAESQVISRFREVFGLSRVKEVPIVVTRRDPRNKEANVSYTFGARAVNYEDYQWVLGKTRDLQQDPLLATFAWKLAYLSIAISSLEGEPVWKAFGFEPRNPEAVSDPLYPSLGLRFQAAESMLGLFKTALFDVVEELYVEYEDKVDSNYNATSTPKEDTEGEENVPLAQSGSEG